MVPHGPVLGSGDRGLEVGVGEFIESLVGDEEEFVVDAVVGSGPLKLGGCWCGPWRGCR